MFALSSNSRFRTACTLLVAAAFTGACADQSVAGPDGARHNLSVAAAPAPWTGSGPGTVTVDNTAGSASLDYAMNPAGFAPRRWDFTTTSEGGGAIIQPWSYSGFHAFFRVRVVLEAVVNGAVVATLVNDGPVNCCTPPSSGFLYNGSYTFNVQPGDTYGFRFGGSNFDSNNVLNGTFTVTLPSDEGCKDGGWATFGFKNQGQCVRYVQTGKDSR